jgi:hypothetical protein
VQWRGKVTWIGIAAVVSSPAMVTVIGCGVVDAKVQIRGVGFLDLLPREDDGTGCPAGAWSRTACHDLHAAAAAGPPWQAGEDLAQPKRDKTAEL